MINRRSFLRTVGSASLGLALADKILAAPYAPLPFQIMPRKPVRIRGAVKSGGKGLKGIAVTDGLSVTATQADGSFDLVSDSAKRFVYISLPPAHEIPVSPKGSAMLYRPIVPDHQREMITVWDLKPAAVPDENHAFLLLADPQTLDMDDMRLFQTTTVPDIRTSVSMLGRLPVFGVGCGDLMFDRLELFPEYERGIVETGIPFFQVLGNHDVEVLSMTDEASAITFLRTFGPTHYSFNRGAIHYVVMDDVFWYGGGYIGYLDQEQLDWLKADLALVEPGRTVIVFMHIPSYCTQHLRADREKPERNLVVTNRELLNKLLAPFRAHVVVGHMHETEHLQDGRVQVHVCGAVCGAWWTGPICADGTPNGYGIYTVRGEDVRWRYKSTGRPAQEQMRLYPRGTDPSAPDAVLANVWDWDPAWRVIWYEDGVRKGEMKPRRGLDPLAVQLHTGPQLPAKHTWVEPYVTDHLFAAQASASAAEITVEASDRWGNTYRSTLP